MDVWIATIQSHILGCLEDNEPTYVTNIINATGSHKINLKFVALARENDERQLTKMTASYDRTAASETRPRGRVKVRSRRARDLQHQRCNLKSFTR